MIAKFLLPVLIAIAAFCFSDFSLFAQSASGTLVSRVCVPAQHGMGSP